MREQSEFERNLEFSLHSLRLLVLNECEDTECGAGGRHFHQVMLDKDQFRKVSDACLTSFTEPDERGMQDCTVQLSEETLPIEAFEQMTDYYEASPE